MTEYQWRLLLLVALASVSSCRACQALERIGTRLVSIEQKCVGK